MFPVLWSARRAQEVWFRLDVPSAAVPLVSVLQIRLFHVCPQGHVALSPPAPLRRPSRPFMSHVLILALECVCFLENSPYSSVAISCLCVHDEHIGYP